MIDLDFDLKAQQARNKFERLGKLLGDLRPVWKEFIPQYRNLIKLEFSSTKGKIMQGKRWDKLGDKYRETKRKKYGNLPLLVVSGELRKKAISFKSRLKKNDMTLSIDGPAYFKYVHNKRAYFHTPEDNLPNIGWRLLIDIAEKEIEKNVQ